MLTGVLLVLAMTLSSSLFLNFLVLYKLYLGLSLKFGRSMDGSKRVSEEVLESW